MIVGCKLPNGITIDAGTPGKNYSFVHCVGRKGQRDSFTAVPDDLGADWFRRNAKLRYVVDGSVYVVPPTAPVTRNG